LGRLNKATLDNRAVTLRVEKQGGVHGARERDFDIMIIFGWMANLSIFPVDGC
jgi:hypothetical protein